MIYKLLALDLDGTLLNRLKKISDRTINVLRNFSILFDCEVAILTGRSFYSASRIIKRLNNKNLKVRFLSCFNGAYNIDLENNQVFEKSSMSIEDSNFLRDLICRNRMGFIAYPTESQDTFTTYRSPGPITYSFCNTKKICAIKGFDKSTPYYKINAISYSKKKVKKFDNILTPFKDKYDCYMTSEYAIEINKKGINKGNSIKKISEILQIDKDSIISFGDSANDIPMFENSSHSFAMKNSNNLVKKTAMNISLENNRHEGVAKTLIEIINKKFNINQQIKKIAIDLDGTLLTHELEIFPQTIKSIQKAEKMGCEIIIATGRNCRDAVYYSSLLKLNNLNYLVVNNGAAIFDVKNNKFIYKSLLDDSLIKEILLFCKQNINHDGMFVQLMNYDAEHDFVVSFSKAKDQIESTKIFERASIKYFTFDQEIDLSKVVKITININNGKINQIKDSIKKTFTNIEVIDSDHKTIEITNINVSKASGMEHIFKINNGRFENLLAIGDSENDLKLLKRAKYAYAVKSNNIHVMNQVSNVTINGASRAVEEVIDKELFGKKNA